MESTLLKEQAAGIGGYFELELPAARPILHGHLQRFQSARAAFYALLQAGRPTKVWMPRLICNAMLTPLKAANVEYGYYDLTHEFDLDSDLLLGPNEWLLYVNYYGLCEANVKSLLTRFPADKVVLDYSQAFFLPPNKEALATIYSPRKLFGLPDGGLLHSKIRVESPKERDQTSERRMEHLITRLGLGPEPGLSARTIAEASLEDLTPKSMSHLTEAIFASIDFEYVASKRKQNYGILRDLIGREAIKLDDAYSGLVPLAYPYRAKNKGLREHLLRHRIFTATYWRDAADKLTADQFENLVELVIPLPIDQRYGEADMIRIADTVSSAHD